MDLIGNIPFIDGFVRSEFLHNQEKGHGTFEPCYIFGFCARAGRVPAFQIMLHCGAQWAHVPIHMLCWKHCSPRPTIKQHALWDCFSTRFSIVHFELLRGLRCHLSVPHPSQDASSVLCGNYLFTVEWEGQWADIPDQHKNHHIIKLADGNFAAYPNNKIRWLDDSYVSDLPESAKDWQRNTHDWSVEGGWS